MTTIKTAFPEKRTQGLMASLLDAASQGFYFCKSCQRICERVDIEGTGWGGCSHCGSVRIEFHPAALERGRE